MNATDTDNHGYNNTDTYDYGVGYDSSDLLASADNKDKDDSAKILKNCGEPTTIEKAIECINNKTYILPELVPAALENIIGTPLYRNILNSSFWINDISYALLGNCHTLNNSVSLSSSNWMISLIENMNYAIYVHDPNFFMLSENPAVIPDILLTMNMTGYPTIYIEVVQHIKIDRLQQPCENKENYSFTSCVTNSVSRKVCCM